MTTAETISEFKESEMLDLGDYLMTTSEAATKNDIINQHILQLNKDLQKACGYGYTALLVDSEAAVILGNDKDHFTANAAFDQTLDGLIGTYRGTPVIRHHALDGWFDDESGNYGVVFAVYKAPDGSLARKISWC